MKPHRIYRVEGVVHDYDGGDHWTVAYTLERQTADDLVALLNKERDDARAWFKEWDAQNPEPPIDFTPRQNDTQSWQRSAPAVPRASDVVREEWQAARTRAGNERLSRMTCPRRGNLHIFKYGINPAQYRVEAMLDDPLARCTCPAQLSTGYDLPETCPADPSCPFHGAE